MKRLPRGIVLAAVLTGCSTGPDPLPANPRAEERHLPGLMPLTAGGENAEAYFSADDRRLILQSTHGDMKADQIFTMPAAGGEMTRVSTGKGKCTCAWFFPDGSRILFASTHMAGDEPPPRPDYSKGYVWAVHDEYDIFSANADGTVMKRLTENPRYDAEGTMNRDGSRIVFTSHREGDLDVYSMKPDGTDVKRLTDEPGYDGGAVYSPDGKKIVYRSFHPTGPELDEFRALLAEAKVRPTTMELWIMDADGSRRRQITRLGGANFAPAWHPDGKRIIFSSNHLDPKSRNFDLFLVNEDGTGLERVTVNDTFDGFPMFSNDGKRLVFASNRDSKVKGETNIFIADWVE
ncbi:MAG: WD-40-like beta propeller repeat-containing [Planctomycetota bacterium]|nr:MAG: WD-40-like beta propeller repeat-containing [Planctomycetota bacterium]